MPVQVYFDSDHPLSVSFDKPDSERPYPLIMDAKDGGSAWLNPDREPAMYDDVVGGRYHPYRNANDSNK